MRSSLLIFLGLLTGCLGAPGRFKKSLNGTKTVHTMDFGSFVREYPYAIHYPYMIELLTTGGHLCGGALVRPNFALTARHCFPKNISDFKDVSRYKLLAGNQIYEDRHSEFVQMRQVEKICVHPENHWTTDLAVVKVTKPFDFNLHVNVIKVAPQSKKDDYLNQTIVAMGWGATERKTHSEYLLKVYGYISKCGVAQSVLCIRGLGGKPQGGDSGGPAVIQGKLGIPDGDLLVGISCAVHPENKWYATNVAFFADWINETIANM